MHTISSRFSGLAMLLERSSATSILIRRIMVQTVMLLLVAARPAASYDIQPLGSASGSFHSSSPGSYYNASKIDSLKVDELGRFWMYYHDDTGGVHTLKIIINADTLGYSGGFAFEYDHDGQASAGGDTCTCVDMGAGKVTCSFAYRSGSTDLLVGSFSYTRWIPKFVRTVPGDTAQTVEFGDSIITLPYALEFSGKTFAQQFGETYIPLGWSLTTLMKLTDAQHPAADSSKDFLDSPRVFIGSHARGLYTATLSWTGTKMFYIPDTTKVTYAIILNPGIYQSMCKGLPWLAFDASYPDVPDSIPSPMKSGVGWKQVGVNSIQADGTVMINNVLRFRGSMRIDTTAGLIDANGEWYIITRLPLTYSTGPYNLGKGKRTLGYSCNGLVSGVQYLLSSDSVAKLAGFGFKFDSITFISDSINGYTGVRIGARILIPYVREGGPCAKDATSSSQPGIGISPIEISTYAGIGGAIHLNNLGIYPGFCIRDAFLSYYSYPDSLSLGAKISAPFFDTVSLSAGWVRHVWDALAFKVQLSTGKGIPIGNTGMLLSGIHGGASGWNFPPLKCNFGGTFDDVVPDFMRWDGDLSYQEPSLLKGSLTVSFIKLLGYWQYVGNITGEVDWNHYAKISGSANVGTLGSGYVMTGSGSLCFTWDPPPADLIGKLNGSISIPKIGKGTLGIFTEYVNSYLPIQIAQGEMLFKSHKLRGNVYVPYFGGAHVAVNLDLPFTDPGFFDFGYGTVPLSATHQQGGKIITSSLPMDTITIPKNSAVAIIRIRSSKTPAASTLIDPTGTVHSGAPADSMVHYEANAGTHHGFWVTRGPQAGKWVLSMPSRSSTDTVDAAEQPVDQPLTFTVSQTGKHVTLNWTPLASGLKADLTAYLDDSSSGYRGFLVSRADDAGGTMSFDLNDSLSACQYYLYAMRDDGSSASEAYATTQLDNSKSAAAPTSVVAHALGGDSVLVRWQPTATIGMNGYAIKVTDASGRDSIYRSVTSDIDTAVLVILDHATKRISVDAYNNGMQSCWSPTVAVQSSVTPIEKRSGPAESLHTLVWPNPVAGSAIVEFTVERREAVHVDIFDVLGNKLLSPVDAIFDAGSHEVSLDLSKLLPGSYFCRVQADNVVETRKIVLER